MSAGNLEETVGLDGRNREKYFSPLLFLILYERNVGISITGAINS